MTKGSHAVLFISALDIWSLGDKKGGPALYRTLTGYVKSGWKVYFITGNKPGDAVEEVIEGIYVYRFDSPWLKRLLQIKKVGFFAKALWWLYFQVKSYQIAKKLHSTATKFDVVYGYEIYGIPVAKLLAKLWGVPMVARFQGTIFRLVWGKRKFRTIRAWEYVVGFSLSKYSDLIIMTNDGSQGDKVLEEFNVNMKKVRFWINGVDWELFENLPAQHKAKEDLGLTDQWVLLCVSRLVSLKRVDRSIRALPEIVKEFPQTVLLVVGDGQERKNLEDLSKQLGVSRHVRFEGAVPHSKIPKYMAAADIFLSFYDWSNVGNPLLEAMMAGKCIVTLNNGDTARFVKNGWNGILLEYKDLPRLPEVVKNLLTNEDLRKKLGANARKFAEENFWRWEERIEAEINEIYNLLQTRARKQ